MPEITCLLKDIWDFLNQSFVSTTIGALLFAYILHRFISQTKSKEITEKIKGLLREQTKQNIDRCDELYKVTKKREISLKPGPLSISSLEVIVSSDHLLSSLPVELSTQAVTCYENLKSINKLYDTLKESTLGVASALSGIGKTKDIIIENLQKELPNTKIELQKLENLLK